MGIVCWSSKHKNYLLYFTVPIILIWVFGYPLTIILLLFKNRKILNDRDIVLKYGLFYVGFKDHTYYW